MTVRNLTRLLAASAVGLVVGLAATPTSGASTPKTFANCEAMHRVYPHGVGKPGAHDHTSGAPVTDFKRSLPLYNANKKSDRDGDGIACEDD
jgi:hypothetical protein